MFSMPSILRNHLISNSQQNMRSSTQLQRPSRLNQICVGCLDGMLVWIHLPSKEECEKIGVGQAKFIYGRKSKCGLNLQAICDAKQQFLDISILFGDSVSDLLAFESSPIRVKMDSPNFFALGCVYLAIMPTSIDCSWPRQYLT